jgi:hypothetical protein
MLTLPPSPYAALKSADMDKLQAYVCPTDKGLLMTVIPDRNLYTLLLTHALKRTADFIRTNDLSFDNDSDQSRLLHFIVNGSDLPPVVTAPSGDRLRKSPTPRAARKTDA